MVGLYSIGNREYYSDFADTAAHSLFLIDEFRSNRGRLPVKPKATRMDQKSGAPENLILTRFFLLHFPDDFHFTRKKKHPEIAHRSHEFFDPSLAPAFPTRASHNQYDSSRERVRNPFYCRASK